METLSQNIHQTICPDEADVLKELKKEERLGFEEKGQGDSEARRISKEPSHKTLWDMLMIWGFILKAMGHHSRIIIK